MPNLKQRLENLEKSAGHDPGTHESFCIAWRTGQAMRVFPP